MRMVNGAYPLIIFPKSSDIDAWQGPKYACAASEYLLKINNKVAVKFFQG